MEKLTKSKATKIFERLLHGRFYDTEEIESVIREESDVELPNLAIGDVRHPQFEDKDSELDDYIDCCFGEDAVKGMQYPDFIIYVLKTNVNELYVTEIDWL